MKVIYDRETDTLTIILTETPVAESDEDKPGVILDYGIVSKHGGKIEVEYGV
jgi:uncharacterized protein YuzE